MRVNQTLTTNLRVELASGLLPRPFPINILEKTKNKRNLRMLQHGKKKMPELSGSKILLDLVRHLETRFSVRISHHLTCVETCRARLKQ